MALRHTNGQNARLRNHFVVVAHFLPGRGLRPVPAGSVRPWVVPSHPSAAQPGSDLAQARLSGPLTSPCSYSPWAAALDLDLDLEPDPMSHTALPPREPHLHRGESQSQHGWPARSQEKADILL